MIKDNPLFSRSLKNIRIKELNDIVDNKLSYIEQKNLLIYIIKMFKIDTILDIVNTNDDYKVLFQLKLFNLNNQDIKKIQEYTRKILDRKLKSKNTF